MIMNNPKYSPETHPVIAIDLDSTIWDAEFPYTGQPYNGAINCINNMVKAGYEVVIWTARGGANLVGCMDVLRNKHGLDPTIKVNEHSDWFLKRYKVQSPKIGAHVYIDDRAFGFPMVDGRPNWYDIHRCFLGKHIK